MEAVANSVDDALIDSLSFKLSNSASYSTDRKSVTFWPSGSNIYKTDSGTKVIRFVLTNDNWLDPSTVKVMFNLVNTNTDPAKMLRTISGAWSFFRRMRIMCQGTLIEDFDYNRTCEMFEVLTSVHNRDNDDIENFGYRADTVPLPGSPGLADLPGIPGSSHQTVGMKLCSGLLNQPKMLPLKYCPLTIELELVNNATDAIVTPGSGVFLASNTSADWSIENVQLKCDICNLDNSLQNNYDAHLLSGKSLPINFNTYITQSQAISGTDIGISLNRAITRLKSIFVTFDKSTHTHSTVKEFNDFYHPMHAVTSYDSHYEIQYQIQIGSKLFPEYPVQSVSEAFAQLKKCLGILGSNFHSVSISPQQYRNNHFIIGCDTEKALQAGFTGINTRQGDLLSIKVKSINKDVNDKDKMPDTLYVVLHSDQIMEISDSGVQVFD
jgi:hypothetical protein